MAVAATTVSAKLYMSFGIRAKMMGMSDEEKEKFQPTYEKVHNAQLNEAEYAPLMVALLLYLHRRRGPICRDDGQRERRDLFLGQGAHGQVHLHADGRAAALRRVHPPHRRDVQGAVTVARGAASDPRGDRRATKGERTPLNPA